MPIKLAPAVDAVPRKAYSPSWCSLRHQSVFEQEQQWLEKAPIEIFLTQPVISRIALHSQSDLENEVGGVLIGRWCEDAIHGEQFIVVDGSLAARHTRHGSAFLTFTTESLLDFRQQIDNNCPGKQIVGWYHTHPGMGVFLSGYDTWLHEHFFPESFQAALVIEPRGRQAGFFLRQSDGYLDARRYYGFGELNACNGASIVRWHNLTRREDPYE